MLAVWGRHCAGSHSPRAHLFPEMTLAHLFPSSFSRKALPDICSLPFLPLPSPRTECPCPGVLGMCWCRHPCKGARVTPPRSLGDLSHPLCRWWSRCRSGRVGTRIGLLYHACSNTQQVFWGQSLGCSPLLCACVGRESQGWVWSYTFSCLGFS